MKMQKLMGAMAIVAFLAACGDSNGPSEGDPLSDLEAEELAGEFVGGALAGMVVGLGGGAQPAPNSSAPPVEFSINITHQEPCEGTGTIDLAVSMSGTIDSDTGDGNISTEVVENITDCEVTVEQTQFIVNGKPSITMTGNLMMAGQTMSGSFTFDGGFSWESDTRAGSCTIDVAIEFSTTSISYQGRVCNTTIDFTATIA